ncbi:MAG TPA: response regulator transcription factor [Candidatus Enterocloster faecavium]|uniref:Stage 0 sporulation protein A homolog n=1 Tax=Candidatus Enterocloster faecavium TaxID=2838560 RepID=A0A9D2L8U7_9FIRM|nr:response regulator transcription factor [Candidatus Enterocloster faecavium]
MRLLIVDDDLHLRKLVRTYAQLEQFQCEEAPNGQEALKLLDAHPFDLVVLDVMMPGLSGFETLTQIRKTSQVPVIMLTARSEEYDKLLGFKLGVDDYVSKPFSPKELMARIGAVLKRSNSPNRTLTFGELSISPESRNVTLRGQNISLSPKEFDLLLKLAQNERIVLSREQLLETIWGYSYCGDSRTVDTHVKSLRDHLGDYRNVIQTVWGVGYKFEYSKK